MIDPFICRVQPSGVPYIVTEISNPISSPLKNFTPDEVCYWYWLLKQLVIKYTFTLDTTAVFETELELSNFSHRPMERVASVPVFESEFVDSRYGVKAESKLTFSEIYRQDNNQYTFKLDLGVYNLEEGKNESTILLSFARDFGDNDCRDLFITRKCSCLGKFFDVYLNYRSGIWESVELTRFEIEAEFYE